MGFSLAFANVSIRQRITLSPPLRYELKFDVPIFVMRVAAEGGLGLMKRSEKPGSDPIFGDGISPS